MSGYDKGDGESVGLSFQPMGWKDYREIRALEKTCFGQDAWPWLDTLMALTWPGVVRIKAMKAGRTVGYVIGDTRGHRPVGWIASICVCPGERREGIGTLLLRACERELATDRIRLALRVSNEAAYRLYKAEGYSTLTTWPNYYRDHEDALVMEKTIEQGGGAGPTLR